MTDEESKVPGELHEVLGAYFQQKHDGAMLVSFMVYAEIMNKDGDRSAWIVPNDDMTLVTKMGIAAYMTENFRAMMQNSIEDDDEGD